MNFFFLLASSYFTRIYGKFTRIIEFGADADSGRP